jgi:hypothetical protein
LRTGIKKRCLLAQEGCKAQQANVGTFDLLKPEKKHEARGSQ